MGIVSERINQLIQESGKSYRDLAADLEMPHTTLARYAKASDSKIPVDAVAAIAKLFRVNPVWIMGLIDSRSPSGDELLRPVAGRRVPVLGKIACGLPMLAVEQADRYELVEDAGVDFCLDAVGDSMVEAGIQDGDVVYIRAQEEVENGEIAAVIIDNECTLKRVFRNGEVLTLVPCNKAYKPMAYIAGTENIRIVGKAVGFAHKF